MKRVLMITMMTLLLAAGVVAATCEGGTCSITDACVTDYNCKNDAECSGCESMEDLRYMKATTGTDGAITGYEKITVTATESCPTYKKITITGSQEFSNWDRWEAMSLATGTAVDNKLTSKQFYDPTLKRNRDTKKGAVWSARDSNGNLVPDGWYSVEGYCEKDWNIAYADPSMRYIVYVGDVYTVDYDDQALYRYTGASLEDEGEGFHKASCSSEKWGPFGFIREKCTTSGTKTYLHCKGDSDIVFDYQNKKCSLTGILNTGCSTSQKAKLWCGTRVVAGFQPIERDEGPLALITDRATRNLFIENNIYIPIQDNMEILLVLLFLATLVFFTMGAIRDQKTVDAMFDWSKVNINKILKK